MSHETPAVTERPTEEWYRNVGTTLADYATRLRDALLYSSAYLATLAASAVGLATVVLGTGAVLAPVAVVWLVTFAVYATDRIADAETDAESMPGHASFAARHGEVLYVLASLAYAAAVSLALFGGPVSFGITLLPGAFWLLYATDWLPEGGVGARRLKEVFLLNSAVVALAWAVTTVFLPLAFAGMATTPAALVVFAYLFVRVFTNVEIPNVRDVDADREIGVRTLPVVLGVRRTRHALYGLDLLTIALVAGAVLTGVLPALPALALIAGVCYSLGITSRIGRTEAKRRLAKLADTEYVVSLVAFAAVSFVF